MILVIVKIVSDEPSFIGPLNVDLPIEKLFIVLFLFGFRPVKPSIVEIPTFDLRVVILPDVVNFSEVCLVEIDFIVVIFAAVALYKYST